MDTKVRENKDFISICIPWFNRGYYLDRVLNSIMINADLPVEIIIHDDSSNDGTTDELFKRRCDISTLILNTGHQLGLGVSANRCVQAASSEYIVFMNADCIFNRPFLKDLRNVLDVVYVGWVGLTDEGKFNEKLRRNGTYFSLRSGVGSGCAFAFSKEVWSLIDGFDWDCRSGCADSPFQYKSWETGLFRATLEGEKAIRNLSQEEKGNTDSSIGKTGYDTAMPKIFNCDSYDEWCKERWRLNEKRFQQMENLPENRGNSLTDITYWNSFSRRLIPEDYAISKLNWGEGHTYHHDYYKNEIMEDFKDEII